MTAIGPAVRAALETARQAVHRPASEHSVQDTIVFALADADLLQVPGAGAEVARVRDALGGLATERGQLLARLAQLQPYEALTPQECPAGQHLTWFAAAAGVPCPWCRIAVLEGRPDTACTTSGCGSLGVFLDTSTQRAAAWIRVEFCGRQQDTRWYCRPSCAAVGLAAAGSGTAAGPAAAEGAQW